MMRTQRTFCEVSIKEWDAEKYRLGDELQYCTQIKSFMGPTWGPPGSCRPQMGPMLAPWTLLSGWDFKKFMVIFLPYVHKRYLIQCIPRNMSYSFFYSFVLLQTCYPMLVDSCNQCKDLPTVSTVYLYYMTIVQVFCAIMSNKLFRVRVHVIHLPTFFRVAPPALRQSYDCPGASGVTLRDMGKLNQYE